MTANDSNRTMTERTPKSSSSASKLRDLEIEVSIVVLLKYVYHENSEEGFFMPLTIPRKDSKRSTNRRSRPCRAVGTARIQSRGTDPFFSPQFSKSNLVYRQLGGLLLFTLLCAKSKAAVLLTWSTQTWDWMGSHPRTPPPYRLLPP